MVVYVSSCPPYGWPTPIQSEWPPAGQQDTFDKYAFSEWKCNLHNWNKLIKRIDKFERRKFVLHSFALSFSGNWTNLRPQENGFRDELDSWVKRILSVMHVSKLRSKAGRWPANRRVFQGVSGGPWPPILLGILRPYLSLTSIRFMSNQPSTSLNRQPGIGHPQEKILLPRIPQKVEWKYLDMPH
jgi:hypothetical protein